MPRPAPSSGSSSLPKRNPQRQVLGEFLRSARARIQPETMGLPPGGRRRTPGLRREELAQLCEISTTWYTWIEQGRDIVVSSAVWARLADVLQLSRAERHYLFELAQAIDPAAPVAQEEPLPDILANSVQAITAPAYILDRNWDVLAVNAAFSSLFENWFTPSEKPNLMRYIFMNPVARHLVVDWEERASRVVAEFRADTAHHGNEPRIQTLIEELLANSAVFGYWWSRHTVVDREGGLRTFNHSQRGLLHYQQLTFRLATHPDCKLIMLLES